MIRIDLENVEKLIFEEESVRRLFPEHAHLFDQWKLGVRIPSLRQLARRSLLDFLDRVTPKELDRLSSHLESQVIKVSLDYNVVKNFEFTIEELCDSICEVKPMAFCLTRGKDLAKLTFWR